MKLNRLARALTSINRLPELFSCFRYFDRPAIVTLVYFKLFKWSYPLDLLYRKKYRIRLESWEDLTTAWVVLIGKEYRIFEDDLVIIDLGANIGVFAVLARSINPKGKIYCVEPFPQNFFRLKNTIKNNDLEDNIFLRECAISSVNGEVIFDSDPDIPSHSRRISQSSDISQKAMVSSYTLESFLTKESLDRVDFIKMDIEGAEYDLILNTDSSILKKVNRFAIEYHGRGHEVITEHLKNAGFEITYHPKTGNSGVIEYSQCNPKNCQN